MFTQEHEMRFEQLYIFIYIFYIKNCVILQILT